MGGEDINVRLIKPFKEFYNQLISIALKYGIFNIHTVSPSDFVEAAGHSLKRLWKPCLKVPTEAFYELCKSEATNAGTKETSYLFENPRDMGI